jgi:ATP-dependent Clp protease protease subunit
MADFMLAFSKKLTVKTSVVGTSYSAATLISAAGTKGHRYAIPSAEFLIHALSIGHIGGKIEDVEETTRHLIRLNGKLASHLSSITGMEMSRVEAMMSKETFLNAQEAIQCGLCDQIGMI